jgi:hypothetical protein
MQPTPQNNQLMSKHGVFSLKPQRRFEWRGQDGQSETEKPDHSASRGDPITSSTRIRFSVHTAGTDARELNPFLIDLAGVAHHIVCKRGIAGSHDTTKEQSHDYKTSRPSHISDGVGCNVGASLRGYHNLGHAVLAK